MHYNITQPVGMPTAAFLARWDDIMQAPCTTSSSTSAARSRPSTASASMKRDELARVKSAVEIDLMRRIKAALDPKGILNPGKVL